MTQLLCFLDDIYKGIENQSDKKVIYTDFEKAFDKVDHGVLLSQLFRLGVHDKLLKLISSYLEKGTVRVKINDILSSSQQTISKEVPQGSILGGYISVFRQPRIQTRQYLDKYCFNQSESRQKKLINNYFLFWIINVFSRF